MNNLTNALASLVLLVSPPLAASDLEKEERWAAQIVDSLLDGEAIHLNDGQHDFLAIETPAQSGRTDHTAIILHGTGVHPNWPTVVQPLRGTLPEADWHTLSIQLPVLANDAEHAAYAALYGEVPGRLDAAIEHARQAGAKRLILIAHSQGSTMAAHYLAGSPKPVEGFIAIGMGPGIAGGPMDNLAHLPAIKVPMLDLYGSEDLPEVVASAEQRRELAGQANDDYSQQLVEGADHFFEGEEEELLNRVNDWLSARNQ